MAAAIFTALEAEGAAIEDAAERVYLDRFAEASKNIGVAADAMLDAARAGRD